MGEEEELEVVEGVTLYASDGRGGGWALLRTEGGERPADGAAQTGVGVEVEGFGFAGAGKVGDVNVMEFKEVDCHPRNDGLKTGVCAQDQDAIRLQRLPKTMNHTYYPGAQVTRNVQNQQIILNRFIIVYSCPCHLVHLCIFAENCKGWIGKSKVAAAGYISKCTSKTHFINVSLKATMSLRKIIAAVKKNTRLCIRSDWRNGCIKEETAEDCDFHYR
jgi:hypothetical protein